MSDTLTVKVCRWEFASPYIDDDYNVYVYVNGELRNITHLTKSTALDGEKMVVIDVGNPRSISEEE